MIQGRYSWISCPDITGYSIPLSTNRCHPPPYLCSSVPHVHVQPPVRGRHRVHPDTDSHRRPRHRVVGVTVKLAAVPTAGGGHQRIEHPSRPLAARRPPAGPTVGTRTVWPHSFERLPAGRSDPSTCLNHRRSTPAGAVRSTHNRSTLSLFSRKRRVAAADPDISTRT